jgi:hypothetical protein
MGKDHSMTTAYMRFIFEIAKHPEPILPSVTIMSVLNNDNVPSFDFDTRLGLVFIVQTACLSVVAVTSLLFYIAVRVTSHV